MIFYGLMLSIVVIILAMALTVPLKQHVEVIMANDTGTTQGLQCSNASISSYQQAQCFLTDVTMPYFFFGLLAIAGAVVGAKVVFGS